MSLLRRALLSAPLLAAPAIAWDPDEMARAMTEICHGAALGAEEAAGAAQPLARAEERALMHARLACIAARIEARADQPRPASLSNNNQEPRP